MDVDNAASEILRLDLQGRAEWWRQKATEDPVDKRSLEAAAVILDRLADSVSDIPRAIVFAWYELFEEDGDFEVWSEMLRRVGFYSEPKDAERLLRDFIADRAGGKVVTRTRPIRMVSSKHRNSRKAISPGDLKGSHIVLVEDSWQVGEHLKGLLQSAGATVAGPAATVVEADRLASERRPEVALVDFRLRRGELADALIHRLSEQGVSVVVISGYEVHPASKVRAAALLKKPFTDNQLLATLQALIKPKA